MLYADEVLYTGDAVQVRPEKISRTVAKMLEGRVGTVVSTNTDYWDVLVIFPGSGREGDTYGFYTDQLVKYKWAL